METRQKARSIATLALGLILMPFVCLAWPVAPHPGWDDVVHLLASRPGVTNVPAIERTFGETMFKRVRAADGYSASIPSRRHSSVPLVLLMYVPAPFKAARGSHIVSVEIFVNEMECVSPARMRQDLLRAGFVMTSVSTSSTTAEYYKHGNGRLLRVAYPSGPTGTNLQLWAINHHTTAEDSRCVGEIYVRETN